MRSTLAQDKDVYWRYRRSEPILFGDLFYGLEVEEVNLSCSNVQCIASVHCFSVFRS